jgi:2-keto-4-pentenoate hydratase/2-oxohepta-3-ene-1,7-dioic acid hydratase in catechol pathway
VPGFAAFDLARLPAAPGEAIRPLPRCYTIFNDFSARDAQRIEMEGRLGPAERKEF